MLPAQRPLRNSAIAPLQLADRTKRGLAPSPRGACPLLVGTRSTPPTTILPLSPSPLLPVSPPPNPFPFCTLHFSLPPTPIDMPMSPRPLDGRERGLLDCGDSSPLSPRPYAPRGNARQGRSASPPSRATTRNVGSSFPRSALIVTHNSLTTREDSARSGWCKTRGECIRSGGMDDLAR